MYYQILISADYIHESYVPNNNTTPFPVSVNLSITENTPIDNIIGQFNAADPDQGSTITYHLVSGLGDSNNSLFSLETNGSLKNAVLFDYETNASNIPFECRQRMNTMLRLKEFHSQSYKSNRRFR